MRYWDEMESKWGFGDGGSCPDGIEIYRDAYIKTVCKLAEHLGSDCRVVPYDRGGCHNFCLRFFVTKKWFESSYIPKLESGKPWPAVSDEDIDLADKEFFIGTDTIMDEAISQARELEIDDFVETNVKLSKDFENFLKTCHRKMIDFQAV
jgi:hypothetical protein